MKKTIIIFSACVGLLLYTACSNDIPAPNTGTMKFINTSSNTLMVDINGAYELQLNGNTTTYQNDIPPGFYPVVVTPLDDSFTDVYTIVIGKGDTATVTVPMPNHGKTSIIAKR